MAHGLRQQLAFGKPARRAPVQLGDANDVAARQARGKKLAEQRMEAVPGLPVIGLDAEDQQVLFLQPLQQVRRLVIIGHRRRQRCIEAPADAHALHESRELRRQVGDHVLGEIGLQVIRLPAQVAQRLARLGAAAQQQDDQLQAGRPAAGQVVDQVHFFRGQLLRG
ncbi:hypothetical protein D3C78_653740 [compost metagenome]